MAKLIFKDKKLTEDFSYDIKESIKSLSISLESIKNILSEPKPFNDDRIVEIDSLKAQKQEMIKQTREMRKQTIYLLCTFIAAILTLLFNIILMIIQN